MSLPSSSLICKNKFLYKYKLKMVKRCEVRAACSLEDWYNLVMVCWRMYSQSVVDVFSSALKDYKLAQFQSFLVSFYQMDI